MSTRTRPAALSPITPGLAVAGGVHALPMLPRTWTVAARRRIEQWFDAGRPDPEHAHLRPSELQDHYTYVSYGDTALRSSPQLHRCIRFLVPHVARIVGTDLIYGPDHLQVGPRFPGESGYPHIDGMGDEQRLDDPMVPTAVLAVYLSDVGADDGALGVWPQLREDVTRYGARRVDPAHDPDQSDYRALMARATTLPATALAGPAGSAYLMHGSLPHCNLPHRGSAVRHALFLRFYRALHYPGGNNRPNDGRALAVLADPGAAWA